MSLAVVNPRATSRPLCGASDCPSSFLSLMVVRPKKREPSQKTLGAEAAAVWDALLRASHTKRER